MKNFLVCVYDNSNDYDLCRFAIIQLSNENIEQIRKLHDIVKSNDIDSVEKMDVGITAFIRSDSITEDKEKMLHGLLKTFTLDDSLNEVEIDNDILIKIFDGIEELTRHEHIIINKNYFHIWGITDTLSSQRVETVEIPLTNIL